MAVFCLLHCFCFYSIYIFSHILLLPSQTKSSVEIMMRWHPDDASQNEGLSVYRRESTCIIGISKNLQHRDIHFSFFFKFFFFFFLTLQLYFGCSWHQLESASSCMLGQQSCLTRGCSSAPENSVLTGVKPVCKTKLMTWSLGRSCDDFEYYQSISLCSCASQWFNLLNQLATIDSH